MEGARSFPSEGTGVRGVSTVWQSDVFRYRLPMTHVRFSGTVTDSYDTILKKQLHASPNAIAEIMVMADSSKWCEAKIKHGFFRDTAVSFEFTEDARLTTASSEVTGQAGKLVLGVIGVAATAAGVVLGLPGLAVAAAAGTIAAGKATGETTFAREEKPAEQTDEEKVYDAYKKAHGDVADLRLELAKTQVELKQEMAATAAALASATDTSERTRLLRQLRSSKEALQIAGDEATKLDRHFAEWRASTIKTTTTDYDFTVPLTDLRNCKLENGAIQVASGSVLQVIWDRLGLAVIPVELGSEQGLDEPEAASVPANGDDPKSSVFVRVPRKLRLDIYRKDDDKALLHRSREYLVMDDKCSVREIDLPKRRLFSKESKTLKFGPGGSLVAVSTASTAAATAAAEIASGLPAGVSGGLEQSKKILDQLSGLSTAAVDQQLAAIKKQVELKQQALVLAGLNATDQQYAELERLKQEAAILENRQKVAIGQATLPDAADLARLKQEVESLKSQLERIQTAKALETEM
jgi:hypothetical protein